MKKLTKNNIAKIFLAVMLILGVYSCSKEGDVSQYIKNGEISYTGKLDSLKIYAGKERVEVTGLYISDPKIVKTKIFWNSKKDSLVVPVNRTQNVDTLSVIINNLPENVYDFLVFNYDKLGNKSVPLNQSAETYGARYEAGLNGRRLTNVGFDASSKKATMDLSATIKAFGVFETQIFYTDATTDTEMIKHIPIDSVKAKISNVKNTALKYRTAFLPISELSGEPLVSIDTFYSKTVEVTPNIIYLKNYKKPFVKDPAATDADYMNLADWTTNSAAKVQGGQGGIQKSTGYSVNFEGAITNGKCYQTMVLPAGKYTFGIKGQSGDWSITTSDTDYNYLVAAKGTTLPDSKDGTLETDPNTLAFKKLVGLNREFPAANTNGNNFEFTFTLTEETEVSLGLSMTQSNKYCVIEQFNFGLSK